jgi:hypothetical protein
MLELGYKEGGLQFSIFQCYSWEMALDVGFDVPFDNTQDSKELREKVGMLIIRKLI